MKRKKHVIDFINIVEVSFHEPADDDVGAAMA